DTPPVDAVAESTPTNDSPQDASSLFGSESEFIFLSKISINTIAAPDASSLFGSPPTPTVDAVVAEPTPTNDSPQDASALFGSESKFFYEFKIEVDIIAAPDASSLFGGSDNPSITSTPINDNFVDQTLEIFGGTPMKVKESAFKLMYKT
ncbi:unnamed protein product, partial [marine sediment metagenome]